MSYSRRDAGVTGSSRRRPKLLDQVRHTMRLRHYSRRSEQAYVGWIRRFILFHDKRHPRDMGGPEVERFLTSLAVDGQANIRLQAAYGEAAEELRVVEMDLKTA